MYNKFHAHHCACCCIHELIVMVLLCVCVCTPAVAALAIQSCPVLDSNGHFYLIAAWKVKMHITQEGATYVTGFSTCNHSLQVASASINIHVFHA